ncbi:hypothetical protein C9J52_11850 [Photobacterium iliopiscarium]|uniref:Uncharacterized protein n=1 Tax=Photobacterium iliopiscarium TaxID=56192 RepID=A0ABX5GS59_9GAMM|nr:hypothetical protein UB38_01120 [Photobacterium iliopiscarium]PSU02000.1 hypothetical protein C9I85_02155 [Photobacterium iliopiscarium]PSV84348.1 hypothetical protein C9J51_04720 [Photobacterium iliopiscarium]PSW95642.1 hypothetical protein C9J52_11850 [Photobacterium iliopiscarium]
MNVAMGIVGLIFGYYIDEMLLINCVRNAVERQSDYIAQHFAFNGNVAFFNCFLMAHYRNNQSV